MLRRPTHALAAAAACAAGAFAVWLIAFGSAAGRRLDGAVLNGFLAWRRPSIEPYATDVAHLADPLPFALAGAALCLIALARGRPRVALMIPAVLLAASVTTQILKPALAAPRPSEMTELGNVLVAAWPSGHATAAMSIALCAVIAVGPRARPWVAALGGAFGVAVSFSFLSLAWHFPSDVLGGYLVAATWTLLGVAAVRALDARYEPHAGRARLADLPGAFAPAAAVAALGVAAAGALALSRPGAALAFAAQHTAWLAGAAAIAVIGVGLAAALAAALRR